MVSRQQLPEVQGGKFRDVCEFRQRLLSNSLNFLAVSFAARRVNWSSRMFNVLNRHPQRWVRMGGFLAVIVPLGLLLLAGRLQPNPTGMGTHQQLGLPPCTTRILLGIPCPACGMTTSWSHFARGQWASSMTVNPGGFLLAIMVLGGLPAAVTAILTGNPPGRQAQFAGLLALLSVAVVSVTNWAIRLVAA